MEKISIVTPCFNAEKYISETILSVVNQRAVLDRSVELEYIICDGQSTDKTLDIAQSLLKTVPSTTYKIISESDTGMYDALAKGLQMTSGSINAYINAGDLYHASAFSVVAEIFTARLAKWIAGYTVCYNERSQIIEATLPYRYRRSLFECGAYGKLLPHVQQESTFWTSHLTKQIDFDALSKLKYAGDFYLWQQFAKVADLKVVRSHLGGFKYHDSQLSQETVGCANAYQLEMQKITRPATAKEIAIAKLDRLVWSAPFKLKKRLAADSFISYNKALSAWATEDT